MTGAPVSTTFEPRHYAKSPTSVMDLLGAGIPLTLLMDLISVPVPEDVFAGAEN